MTLLEERVEVRVCVRDVDSGLSLIKPPFSVDRLCGG